MTKVFDGHVHGGLNMEQLGIHDFSCYGLQVCSPYTKTTESVRRCFIVNSIYQTSQINKDKSLEQKRKVALLLCLIPAPNETARNEIGRKVSEVLSYVHASPNAIAKQYQAAL